MLNSIENYRFEENSTDYDEATNSAVQTVQDFVSRIYYVNM